MIDARPILSAYDDGMSLVMITKQFDMSLHKVLEIIYYYKVRRYEEANTRRTKGVGKKDDRRVYG